METRTVKPPKALPNTLRKVMPRVVVATKLSQGIKDLENPKYITQHSTNVHKYHIIHLQRFQVPEKEELGLVLTADVYCRLKNKKIQYNIKT